MTFSRRDPRHNRGRVGSRVDLSVPPVDPLTTSGLLLDLNFQNVASYTITGGTTVTSVTNTGSGGETWTEETNPPAYELAGLNGRPCIKGNGSTTRLLSPAGSSAAIVAPFLGAAPTFTALWVAENSAQSNSTLWGVANSAAANGTMTFAGITASGSRSTRVVWNNDGGGSQTSTTPVHPAPAAVYGVVFVANNIRFFRNGALIHAAALTNGTGATLMDRCGLLCNPRSVPTSFTSGRLGRLLAWGAVYTDAEVAGFSSFLKIEWGLS